MMDRTPCLSTAAAAAAAATAAADECVLFDAQGICVSVSVCVCVGGGTKIPRKLPK